MPPPRSTKELFAEAIADLPDDMSINAACYRAVQEYEAFQKANAESNYEKAFTNYIRALTLVAERIPASPAYRGFCKSGSDDFRTYQDLRKLISADPSISQVREHIDQKQRLYRAQNQQDDLNDAPTTPESPGVSPDDLVQRFEKLKGHSRKRPSGPRDLRSRNSSIVTLHPPDSNLPSPDLYPDHTVIPPPPPVNPPPAPPFIAHPPSSAASPPTSFPQTIPPVPPLNFPPIPPLSSPPIPRTNKSYDLASHVANGSSSSSTSTSTSTSATTVNPHVGPIGTVFPKTSVINAETLRNYLSSMPDSILIADIRRRSDFDMAHLRHRHILCIEPSSLSDGMKDSDLEKVIEKSAPPEEISLFTQRDRYKLLVYYDKDSDSRQENFALPLFSSAVYLNAFMHPLKRAPCFLVGGLEAWVELVGVNGVEHNSTPSFLSQPEVTSFRPPSPIVHRPDWPRQGSRNASSALGFYETKAENQGNRGSGFRTPSPRGGDSYEDGPSEYSEIEVSSRGRLPKRLDELASRAFRPSSQPAKVRKREEASMATRDKYLRDVNDYFQQLSITPPPSATSAAHPGAFTSSQYNGNHNNHSTHPSAPLRPPPPVVPAPAPPNASTSSLSRLNNISSKLGNYHLHNRNGGREYQQAAPYFQSNFYRQPVHPHLDAITGLKNLGNSCYMNSIIQCLAGSLPLAYIFLDNSYKEYINSKSVLGTRGEFAHMFARLMFALYSEGHPYVVPVSFKQISGRLRPEFAGCEQQDAQEFLTFTLDELHEDLNVNGGRPRLRPLTEEEERKREGLSVRFASFIEWQRYLKSDQSIIVDLFQGQYMSRLRCTHCKFTSTTYNPFSFLTLPIPSTKKTSLIDCFNVFVEKETLEGSNGWNCPECKKKRKAKKSLTLSRLPQILIIQLKRFQNYGDRSDKIETLVDFPLDKLDLTKYWPPYTSKDKDWLKEHPEPSQQPPFVYRLYAVTNHYGTLKGGHYTALVRKGSKGWWLFDDTRAVPVYQNIVSANAYILFYVRDMPGSAGSF